MGQIFDNGGAGPPQTTSATSMSNWFDVGRNIEYYIDLSVENLSGTTPTHDWSIEDATAPNVSVTTLFASGTFTQVTGGPFPNTQRKLIALTGDATSSKRFIRINWTLAGTNPVATVSFSINKVKYGPF